jgi:hypothetical protein
LLVQGRKVIGAGRKRSTSPAKARAIQVSSLLENIRDAIQGYLELYGAPDLHCEIREMEVTSA